MDKNLIETLRKRESELNEKIAPYIDELNHIQGLLSIYDTSSSINNNNASKKLSPLESSYLNYLKELGGNATVNRIVDYIMKLFPENDKEKITSSVRQYMFAMKRDGKVGYRNPNPGEGRGLIYKLL